jgi:electron transfer flavoprotein beta subunit
MSDLHIVVCLKVVPKPEEIRVDHETWRLIREGARSEINPPDMNALEMALSLKDLHGGRISLVSMGPGDFEPYLRIGLAMGADAVYLLSDREFAGADTLATTYTLARGIKKLGPISLILCGEESSDGATGQVPPGLAEWLELPQITFVNAIEFDHEGRFVRGKREVAGGYEIIQVPIPAVISVKTACNEPRFMDFEIKEEAMKESPLTVWNSADLNADKNSIGVPGSPTTVTGIGEAESRERRREFITGDLKQQVKKLSQVLAPFLQGEG